MSNLFAKWFAVSILSTVLVCQFLVSFKYLHWFYSIHSDFLFPCSFVYILFVKSQHHCIKLIMACYTLKLWTPVTIYNCQLFTGVNTIDWCTLKQMATTDFYIIVWKLWKNIVLCVYTCNWNSFCCLGIFHRTGPKHLRVWLAKEPYTYQLGKKKFGKWVGTLWWGPRRPWTLIWWGLWGFAKVQNVPARVPKVPARVPKTLPLMPFSAIRIEKWWNQRYWQIC